MRIRVIGGGIAATAACAALGLGASAIWASAEPTPAGTSLLVGFYTPAQQIAITNLTVKDSTYTVEYGAEVQFFASEPGTRLQCGLVDASGRIGYLDDTVFTVPPTGVWTRVGDSASYDVPEITLGIRCSPTASGSFGIGYRDVSLTAVPATAG